MDSETLSVLKQVLYKKIRCPECKSKNSLEYKRAKNIICNSCRASFNIVNGVPILLSKQSKKSINPQMNTQLGRQMKNEYSNTRSTLRWIKGVFSVPDLTYDFIQRKRLHEIFTYKENPEYLVLNIGGGPRREDSNVLNLNIDVFPNVEVVGDAHNLPFESNSMNSVMIAAVLEHVQDPPKVVEEIYRVLKYGGYVYSETPFLQHFHGYPSHFQNFTLIGHDYLFRKFKKIESGPTNGPISTILILILNLVEDTIDNKYVRKIVMYVIASVLYPFKYLDRFNKNKKNAFKLANGVYYLGQKQ